MLYGLKYLSTNCRLFFQICLLKSNMNISFPGSSAGAQNPQPYKYSWMGSVDNSVGISRDCTQDLTNFTDPNIFDGHIWKINI